MNLTNNIIKHIKDRFYISNKFKNNKNIGFLFSNYEYPEKISYIENDEIIKKPIWMATRKVANQEFVIAATELSLDDQENEFSFLFKYGEGNIFLIYFNDNLELYELFMFNNQYLPIKDVLSQAKVLVGVEELANFPSHWTTIEPDKGKKLSELLINFIKLQSNNEETEQKTDENQTDTDNM